jgi:hypothetical protein
MNLQIPLAKDRNKERVQMYGLRNSVLPQFLPFGNLIPDFNDMVIRKNGKLL